MKSKPVEQVEEFHRIYGLPILEKPELPSTGRINLRLELILEEFAELCNAVEDKNIVETADALGDLLYVVIGAALEFGIPLDEVVDEIHKSNLSKLNDDGEPLYRNDGKVVKGPNYVPPNIKAVLEQEKQ